MSLPLELVPDLLEDCFDWGQETTELDGAQVQTRMVFRAKIKVLAKKLRSGDYGTAELSEARKYLSMPPTNGEWDQESWDIMRCEFNAAVDMVEDQ